VQPAIRVFYVPEIFQEQGISGVSHALPKQKCGYLKAQKKAGFPLPFLIV
jgi:hypothetical protein